MSDLTRPRGLLTQLPAAFDESCLDQFGRNKQKTDVWNDCRDEPTYPVKGEVLLKNRPEINDDGTFANYDDIQPYGLRAECGVPHYDVRLMNENIVQLSEDATSQLEEGVRDFTIVCGSDGVEFAVPSLVAMHHSDYIAAMFNFNKRVATMNRLEDSNDPVEDNSQKGIGCLYLEDVGADVGAVVAKYLSTGHVGISITRYNVVQLLHISNVYIMEPLQRKCVNWTYHHAERHPELASEIIDDIVPDLDGTDEIREFVHNVKAGKIPPARKTEYRGVVYVAEFHGKGKGHHYVKYVVDGFKEGESGLSEHTAALMREYLLRIGQLGCDYGACRRWRDMTELERENEMDEFIRTWKPGVPHSKPSHSTSAQDLWGKAHCTLNMNVHGTPGGQSLLICDGDDCEKVAAESGENTSV